MKAWTEMTGQEREAAIAAGHAVPLMPTDACAVNPRQTVTPVPLKGAVDLLRKELEQCERAFAAVLGLPVGTQSMMAMIYTARDRLAHASLAHASLAEIDRVHCSTIAVQLTQIDGHYPSSFAECAERAAQHLDVMAGNLRAREAQIEAQKREIGRLQAALPDDVVLPRYAPAEPPVPCLDALDAQVGALAEGLATLQEQVREQGERIARLGAPVAKPHPHDPRPGDGAHCSRCGALLTFRGRGEPGALCSRCFGGPHDADHPLQPGDTWRDPEGTEYEVVRAEDVGERPRWLVGHGTTPEHLRFGLRTRADLHTKTIEFHPYALVLRDQPPASEPGRALVDAKAFSAAAAELASESAAGSAKHRSLTMTEALSIVDREHRLNGRRPPIRRALWKPGICIRWEDIESGRRAPHEPFLTPEMMDANDWEVVGIASPPEAPPDAAVNRILASIDRALAEPPRPGEFVLRHIYRDAELATIPPGLYELTWKVGGTALAAVGMYADGRRWFAPTTWNGVHMPSVDWALVESATEVKAPSGGAP